MKAGNMRIIGIAAVAIALCLVFSYFYIGPGGDPGDGSDEGSGEGPSEGPLSGQVFIVHTNDVHGSYTQNMTYGNVSAMVNDLESRGATVFLVDAGDAMQGSAYTMLTHGQSSVDIMNSVGYDLMVPGNHEFDYTLDTCLDNAEALDCPTICANLDWADSGESVFDEYLVIEEGGYRIGFFGLATPDTVSKVMGGYLDDVVFTDPVEAAEEMVATLGGQDVDWIVCVGHIGVDPTSSITSDEICAQVDGIDLFIDGHSHTAMSGGQVLDGSITLQESETVIASTGAYLNHIGVVCLTSDTGIDAMLISLYDDTDAEVDAVVQGIYDSLDEMLSQVVGRSDIDLTGERTASRLGEVGVGDLVTDIIREGTGADIALYNGGAIRAPLAAGDVTKLMLYTSLPFENTVITKTMTGQQIWDLIENGLSGLPAASGGYQQVSGITVTYDSSRPAGERLESIALADGTPLDLSAEYLVASNDFMMAGGDGYEFMADIPVAGNHGLTIDMVFSWFEENGTLESIDTGRLFDTAPSNHRWDNS